MLREQGLLGLTLYLLKSESGLELSELIMIMKVIVTVSYSKNTINTTTNTTITSNYYYYYY